MVYNKCVNAQTDSRRRRGEIELPDSWLSQYNLRLPSPLPHSITIYASKFTSERYSPHSTEGDVGTFTKGSPYIAANLRVMENLVKKYQKL